ncbi:MAG TPA: hypothetical protein ENO19_09955, partial [Halothiobacillaceae bacterium]|nr:hypothetical protein [Halothiobacillaceae bacterium]
MADPPGRPVERPRGDHLPDQRIRRPARLPARASDRDGTGRAGRRARPVDRLGRLVAPGPLPAATGRGPHPDRLAHRPALRQGRPQAPQRGARRLRQRLPVRCRPESAVAGIRGARDPPRFRGSRRRPVPATAQRHAGRTSQGPGHRGPGHRGPGHRGHGYRGHGYRGRGMNELDPITFPLQGSRLIEASAGTGKTFTISLLYLRLVLGHRGPEQRHARPLTPPEILVSTFTLAAVAELRDRIRSRLQQAAWLFAGTRDEEEVDQPLRDLYDEFDADERARGAFLLQRAAEWMDEAAIFTIHGFCQRQLAEHAFHSGALFEQELITDLDPLIHVAVRDFWRRHGYPLASREALARQFARLVDTPGALKEKVRNLIKRDGSRLAVGEITAGSTSELSSPAELLDRLSVAQERTDTAEARAREAWLADIDTLHGLWNGVRPGLSKKSHAEAKTEDEFAAWLAGVDDWAAGTGTLGEADRKKLARPSANKGHEPPVHPALDAIGDWHAALARLDEQVDEIRPTVQAFAALWIRERIASLLASRRAMGFEDMLIQMRDAVDPKRNPNARGMIEAIRAQYPVAMIDEFQDTDPLQYAIFSAVYPLGPETPASDEHAIVLIGDPKQAIYSFRGADIHSYLTARRATAGRHASLPCNFRSTQAMVGAVNAMFSVADEHPDGAFRFPLDGGTSPLPFEKVQAKGRDDRLVDQGGELPAVKLWASPP